MAGQVRGAFSIAIGLFIALFIQAKQAEKTFTEQVRVLEKRLTKVIDKETKRLVEPLFSQVKKEPSSEKNLEQLNNALSSLYMRMLPQFVTATQKKYEHDFRSFTIDSKKLYEYLDVSLPSSFDTVCMRIKEKTKKMRSALQYEQRRESMLSAKHRMIQRQIEELQDESHRQAFREQKRHAAESLKKAKAEQDRLHRELKIMRQIRFYIGHPLGKQEYDAYLRGRLADLVIEEKDSRIDRVLSKVKHREQNKTSVSLRSITEDVLRLLAQQMGGRHTEQN